uniref:mitotic spindle assembly checkpoint protein MAD1 isoform X2 n=1 Tax=Myxine glutinosa TaxID=7769 RepID=UPI00358F3220
MDDSSDSKTVFDILHSYQEFLTKGSSAASSPSPGRCGLQTHFMQMMQLEEKAEMIHTHARVVKLESEKQRLRESNKRARIEFEHSLQSSASKHEREQELQQERLARLQSSRDQKLLDTTDRLATAQGTIRSQSNQLMAERQQGQEREAALAKAHQTLEDLHLKMEEQKLKFMELQHRAGLLSAERDESVGLLGVQKKLTQDAKKRVDELEISETKCLEQEVRIKKLEAELASCQQERVVALSTQRELAHKRDIEKEVQSLREENKFLRETRENTLLLQEELRSLRARNERFDRLQEENVRLEFANKELQAKLQAWEDLEKKTGLCTKTPNSLLKELQKLQQRESVLVQENGDITARARSLERSCHEGEVARMQVNRKLQDEQGQRQHFEQLSRQLQKRTLLLKKERDGMRDILESYDADLTLAGCSPQLVRRTNEAEASAQRLRAHVQEIEGQLSEAREESNRFRTKVHSLETLLAEATIQCVTSEGDKFCKEEGDKLRKKVEELEMERQKLEEEKQVLKEQAEDLKLLQGTCNSNKERIFHLTENPASAAREQNRVRVAELQAECYNLRECIRALEAGNCTTGTLSDLPPSREVSELQKQLDSMVMKNQRLKEVFQKKIQEFRTVCYILFGYMLDFQQDGQYKLTSMYAEQEADTLLFKQLTAQENGVQLLETEFSKSEAVLQLIELHLHHQKSFPAFLSALTLDLFSRQTCM